MALLRPPPGTLRALGEAALSAPERRTEVAVSARAKLTLSLRVTGVRPDGYHLLEAEMVTVDLADTLHFSAGEGLEIVDEGAASMGHGHDHVPTGTSNLVLRALELAGRQAHVRLVKRIPAGAGLGGGSADAAAVLRWAGARGASGLALASKLGSDVPFCLLGRGRARVSGCGEVVEPLVFEEVVGTVYTLLTPPFGVPTGAVYQTWDDMGGPWSDNFNDLEPAALRVEPRLVGWRDQLGQATGQTPVLAGSGSTWFVRGAYPGDGRSVVGVDRDNEPEPPQWIGGFTG
jgi:4-diphosphocytidyl-2-C-methyl-D-erythritol kinase